MYTTYVDMHATCMSTYFLLAYLTKFCINRLFSPRKNNMSAYFHCLTIKLIRIFLRTTYLWIQLVLSNYQTYDKEDVSFRIIHRTVKITWYPTFSKIVRWPLPNSIWLYVYMYCMCNTHMSMFISCEYHNSTLFWCFMLYLEGGF